MDGFLEELRKWEEAVNSWFTQTNELETKLTQLNQPISPLKAAFVALSKWVFPGIIAPVPHIEPLWGHLYPPLPMMPGSKEAIEAKSASINQQYEESIDNYVRASWFTQLYSASGDDIKNAGIHSSAKYFELHPPEPGTSQADLARAKSYLDYILKPTVVAKPPEGLAEQFITTPLETKPKFKGIHITTVDEMIKYLRREVPPPELPSDLSEQELLDYLKEHQDLTDEELAEIELSISPWSERIQQYEAGREQIKRYKLGLDAPELPKEGIGKKLLRGVSQPVLAILDIMQPYWTYWDYPRSAIFTYAALGIARPEEKKQLGALYQANRDAGLNYWMAWSKAWEQADASEWKKMGIELATDPLNLLGFGLLVKLGKATKTIPVIGRMTGVLGAGELGFIKITEAPFTGIKGLFLKIPKTAGQRSVLEGKHVLNTLVGFHEQAAMTGSMRKVSNETYTKQALAAIDYHLANPEALDWVGQAGEAYIRRPAMTHTDIITWGKTLGVDIVPETITEASVANLEHIVGLASTLGARHPKLYPDAAAAKIAKEILGVPDSIENIALIRGLIDNTYTTALERGTTLAKMPRFQSLRDTVSNVEKIALTEANEGIYKWEMRHGFAAGLINHVNPLYRTVWSNFIERHIVMPFSRAYLITGLYLPWNYPEEVLRTFFGRGGFIYGRNTPIRLKNKVGRGLAYDKIITEAADMAQDNWGSIAKQLSREGAPMGAGEISAATLLTKAETEMGKSVVEKALLFGWIPKVGKRVHEALLFPIRASSFAGSLQKSGYTITRYYDELAKLAPDTLKSIKATITNPPVIPGMSDTTRKAIIQSMTDDAVVGPTAIRTGIKDFNAKSIKLAEVSEAMQKYPNLGIARDNVLDGIDTGKLWDDVPGFVNNQKDIAAMELMETPEIATRTMENLVNEALEIPDAMTKEHLLGLTQLLRDISTASDDSISRLFIGLHERASRVRSATTRRQIYSAGYNSIEPFLNQSEKQSKRLMERIRASMGDLLTEAESEAMERNITTAYARIADLQATRLKQIAKSEEMIATKVIKPGTEAWYSELNAIWAGYTERSPMYIVEQHRAAKGLDNLINPRATPAPIINASIRGLTPADVGQLLYAPGDKLSYAIMNSQTLMQKPSFIAVVADEANDMALRAGVTREALGFTDEAIGKVYDQVVYSLRLNPATHNILSAKYAELDNLARDLESIKINNFMDKKTTSVLDEWAEGIAGNLEGLDIYKKPVVAAPVGILPTKPPITPAIKFGTGITPDLQTRLTILLDKLPQNIRHNIKSIQITPSHKKFAGVTGHDAAYIFDENLLLFKDVESVTPTILYHEVYHSLPENLRMLINDEVVELVTKNELLKSGKKRYSEYIADRLSEYIQGTLAPSNKVYSIFNKHFPKPAIGVVKPPITPTVTREGTSDWWNTKQKAMDNTMKTFYRDFTDYTNMNALDTTMRQFFPYWQYEYQRLLWVPRNFITHPGVMQTWGKYMDNSDNGYVHMPGTNLGINLTIGSVYKGGMSSLLRRDYPEYYDQYFPELFETVDYVQRWGFFPNVFWNFLITETGGRQPQRGQLLPAVVGTPLDLFVAAHPDSEPARILYNILFPDIFREYMQITQMQHLASEDQIQRGINGETIWTKLQIGTELTEEEEQLYHAAVRDIAAQGAWMEHASIFRLRHDERIEAYELMDQLKEEITGVPVALQKDARRHGYSLGDICPGLSQADIIAIEELDEYQRWITPRITAPLRPSNEIENNLILSEFWGLVKQNSENNAGKIRRLEYMTFLGIDPNTGEEAKLSRREYRNRLSGIASDNTSYIHKLHGDTYDTATGTWLPDPRKQSKYQMVPITAEQRAAYYAEKGVNLSMNIFDEMLAEWFQLSVMEKIDPETGAVYTDWGTYFATQDAIEKLMTPDLKAEWNTYLRRNDTPGRSMLRDATKNYLVPYWNVADVIKASEFTTDEQSLIDEYYRIKDIDPMRGNELKEILRGDGTKLISQYSTKISNARKKLRMVSPTVDAQLMYWNYTSTLLTPEAETIYNQLVEQSRNYYEGLY